jgi:putative NAD(P)H nitroreductase
MHFEEIVTARRSVKNYDPNHTISDAELKAIFDKVVLAPSSFNLQHWRFIVVRDRANKEKLCKAAFDQPQVKAASAAIVVAGKLSAHEDAPRIYAESPQSIRDAMLPMIRGFYAEKPAMQRDEAIRSGALAAMTLMYAAQDAGYATGPMIGFDPDAVGKLVGHDEHHIPVMLVVIGKQTGDIRPRPHRLPVEEVVKFETLGGSGLV